VVIDSKGQVHAVLMVRTSRGDLILDNARDAVLPWQQTGYRFVKRKGTEGSLWVSLDKQKGPAVTASQ
jgi:predicted transglutaminase-like cysteine proteinase